MLLEETSPLFPRRLFKQSSEKWFEEKNITKAFDGDFFSANNFNAA
jgi:hypothetical protein